MRTLGKRVGSQGSREFESRPLRQFSFSDFLPTEKPRQFQIGGEGGIRTLDRP